MLSLCFFLILEKTWAHEDKEISYSEITRVLTNRYELKVDEQKSQEEAQKKVLKELHQLEFDLNEKPAITWRKYLNFFQGFFYLRNVIELSHSHFEKPQPGQVTQPPSCITEPPQSGQVVIFLKVKSVTFC